MSLNTDSEYSTSKCKLPSNSCLQMRSDNSVALISIESMEFRLFRDFFGQTGEQLIPYAVQYSERNQKLVGLFELNGKMHISLCNVIDGRITSVPFRKVTKTNSDIFFPKTMVMNYLEDSLIVGGSDTEDIRMGGAHLYVLKFDESLTVLDSLELNIGKDKLMAVTAMSTINDKNLVVAGAFSALFVVEWNGHNLCIINTYSNVHSCKCS